MRNDFDRLRPKLVIFAVISAVFVATLVTFNVRVPLVVYNGSGSAPLGFYWVELRLPGRGEMAVVEPPPSIELMLVGRGLLPAHVPLVKQVAAIGGDIVCRSRIGEVGIVTINGHVVAEAYEKDRLERALPSWDGCLRLIAGEFFLLQPHPHSFDSRYFGPMLRCDILGVAHPIWTWNPPD
ncbi:S26 family signal peptidase [Bradyrhizobium prioriisuperbiae]|uniref:S26 family signal peptidase n=1 Tax=Bradyrhizobium prioriisuperbiae TaxID=2854389 RepID=UPI0028E3924C|nr:S26 family signal peptidase [Bradyrhizobium prioritasuperba]